MRVSRASRRTLAIKPRQPLALVVDEVVVRLFLLFARPAGLAEFRRTSESTSAASSARGSRPRRSPAAARVRSICAAPKRYTTKQPAHSTTRQNERRPADDHAAGAHRQSRHREDQLDVVERRRQRGPIQQFAIRVRRLDVGRAGGRVDCADDIAVVRDEQFGWSATARCREMARRRSPRSIRSARSRRPESDVAPFNQTLRNNTKCSPSRRRNTNGSSSLSNVRDRAAELRDAAPTGVFEFRHIRDCSLRFERATLARPISRAQAPAVGPHRCCASPVSSRVSNPRRAPSRWRPDVAAPPSHRVLGVGQLIEYALQYAAAFLRDLLLRRRCVGFDGFCDSRCVRRCAYFCDASTARGRVARARARCATSAAARPYVAGSTPTGSNGVLNAPLASIWKYDISPGNRRVYRKVRQRRTLQEILARVALQNQKAIVGERARFFDRHQRAHVARRCDARALPRARDAGRTLPASAGRYA